jgi:hypothetical protein
VATRYVTTHPRQASYQTLTFQHFRTIHPYHPNTPHKITSAGRSESLGLGAPSAAMGVDQAKWNTLLSQTADLVQLVRRGNARQRFSGAVRSWRAGKGKHRSIYALGERCQRIGRPATAVRGARSRRCARLKALAPRRRARFKRRTACRCPLDRSAGPPWLPCGAARPAGPAAEQPGGARAHEPRAQRGRPGRRKPPARQPGV